MIDHCRYRVSSLAQGILGKLLRAFGVGLALAGEARSQTSFSEEHTITITKADVKRGLHMTGDAYPAEFISRKQMLRKSLAKGDFVISDSGSQVAIKSRPKSSMREVIERMDKAKEVADQIVKSLHDRGQS